MAFQTTAAPATAPPATHAPTSTCHTSVKVFVQGSQVAIQPRTSQSGGQQQDVETVSINLDTGSVQVLPSAPQPGSPTHEALGVLGVCKLHSGVALLVVTSARQVAVIDGAPIYEVQDVKVITSPNVTSDRANRVLLRMLRDGVDPNGAGRGLHFSFYYDLTLTAQRAAKMAAADPQAWTARTPAERADHRFFWNRVVAEPMVEAGAARFVVPCILGFVQQLPGLEFKEVSGAGRKVKSTLTLLARRSVARAGTRQWRRGADPQGNCANFAETEQMLSVDEVIGGPSSSSSSSSPASQLAPGVAAEPAPGLQASYVEVRGSIPLLWTQLPNIKYKPTTLIAPSDQSGPAHDAHFGKLTDQYKQVVAINLINHHGTEGKLEAAFRSEMARLVNSGSDVGSALRYLAFDFHAECGNKRYYRLSVLWDQIAADCAEQGFFLRGVGDSGSTAAAGTAATGSTVTPAPVLRQQQGVMRINCIDCLDRTNVVQGVLARKAVEAMLVSMGLLPDGGTNSTLPEAYPEVERQFKIMWADHGDALSTQYAGTGAMKSGFTRTGKRTTAGVIDDGVKAVVRYYLNNYQDGHKQDAIDLVTGTFRVDPTHLPPLSSQPSPLIPIFLGLIALGLSAHNLGAILRAVVTGTISVPASIPLDDFATAAGGAENATAAGPLANVRKLLGSVMYRAGMPVTPLTGVDGSAGVGQPDVAGGVTLNTVAASIAEQGASTAGTDGMAAMGAMLSYVVVPFLLGMGMLVLVVRNGKYLVNKPQLCPQLAVTVQRPAKAAGVHKAH